MNAQGLQDEQEASVPSVWHLTPPPCLLTRFQSRSVRCASSLSGFLTLRSPFSLRFICTVHLQQQKSYPIDALAKSKDKVRDVSSLHVSTRKHSVLSAARYLLLFALRKAVCCPRKERRAGSGRVQYNRPENVQIRSHKTKFCAPFTDSTPHGQYTT